MKTYRNRWLDLTAQYCRAEFGIAVLLSVIDGRHLCASVLLGPIDLSVDVWL